LEADHQARPEARVAHKALAKAVTDLIHGESATEDSIRASEVLFGGEVSGISGSALQDVIGEVPTKSLGREQLASGFSLLDALVLSGLSSSKGQAKKDIEGGGIYVNNVRENSMNRTLQSGDALFGKQLLLRKGKRNYVVLSIHS